QRSEPPGAKHRDQPGRWPKLTCPACRSRKRLPPPHLAAPPERRPTRSAETPHRRPRSPDPPQPTRPSPGSNDRGRTAGRSTPTQPPAAVVELRPCPPRESSAAGSTTPERD